MEVLTLGTQAFGGTSSISGLGWTPAASSRPLGRIGNRVLPRLGASTPAVLPIAAMIQGLGVAFRSGLSRVERAVEAVGQAGVSSVLWPVLSGVGLASLVGKTFPNLAKLLHPKFGSLAVAALCLSLILLGCVVIARWRNQTGRIGWAAASQAVQRWTVPLTLIPIYLAVSGRVSNKHPLLVLGFAALAGICAGYFAWLHCKDPKQNETLGLAARRDRKALWGVAGLIASYTILFSVLSILNHVSFKTGRADLGYYVSIFRRSSIGDPLGCTICGGFSHLSGHFDPILVLLSPLYWLYQEAETVLVLQSLLLGSAMLPLYLLARHHGLSRLLALTLLLCFGLHPALHGINLFDFHSLALLVPAVLWVLWAWEREHTRLFLVFFGLMLLVREDAALVGIFIAAYVSLSGRRGAVKVGLALITFCVAYFAFVKGVLMSSGTSNDPIGKGYEHYYGKLVAKGTGTKGLMNTVFGRPDRVLKTALTEPKLKYWLQLMIPVAFLPLLARRGKMLLLYGAAFTLLASRQFVYSIHFHYSSVILPFLFALAAAGLARIKSGPRDWQKGRWQGRRLAHATGAAMLGATLLCSWKFGAILPNGSFRAGLRPFNPSPTEANWRRHQALKEVCQFLPKDAVVAADGKLLPHLGRCRDYRRKEKRYAADYLVWINGAKGKTSPKIRTEVRAGVWKPVKAWHKVQLYKSTLKKGERKRKKLDKIRRAQKKKEAKAKRKKAQQARNNRKKGKNASGTSGKAGKGKATKNRPSTPSTGSKPANEARRNPSGRKHKTAPSRPKPQAPPSLLKPKAPSSPQPKHP